MSNSSVITLANVSVQQSSTVVLKDVNFNVAPGEFVYLVGRTGSGKSSLMKILYGELSPLSGTAKIAGYSMNEIKDNEIPFLRRRLGIVFQDFQLLSDRTINGNLKFVMRATGWKSEDEMTSRVNELLEKTGLSGKGSKFPHELSGGEQQRVAIARALINKPQVILADEPTGNLDPETSEEIMKLLLEITKNGTAILFATHDFLLIQKFPSRTLTCSNGLVADSQSVVA
jgi:cell division transport system ATP-binding protein